MKTPTSREKFLDALLAQETLLEGEGFDVQRRQILKCLAEAEKKEWRSRKIALWVAAACLAILLGLLAAAASSSAFQNPEKLPEWFLYTLAIIVILSIVLTFLICALYFLRYRRPLGELRKQASKQALLALPRQMNELRQSLEELRAQVLRDQPSPPTTRTRENDAFTLVEMLTVVAILGILASLALPALSGAKTRARAKVCKSNLSQIGRALAIYEADYHYLPGAGEAGIVRSKEIEWARPSTNSWIAKITPSLGSNPNVLLCPEYNAPVIHPPLRADSFGYNAGGSAEMFKHMEANIGLGYGQSNFVASSSVSSPSDMVAAGDLQLVQSLWANIITPQTKPIGWLIPVPSRHAGGANMLFVDSHVEWQKRAAWTAENALARSRWNNDHQPHPETWR